MATVDISSSALGNSLQSLLMSDEIVPGSDTSYELCKTIYLWHPLGQKIVEKPLEIAMSQARDISIPNSPEDMIKEAFLREWEEIGADEHIFNVMSLSRIYGIASIVYGAVGVPTDRPIDPKELYNLELYFNVFDPLNTAGSLVLNQNPNAPDFQKHSGISVSGSAYHRSRSCTMMNERPIYISYTTSAFGFVGRSVFQRALFPLKTFIQSMITDDLVTLKAGVLVAKTKQAGSIVDRSMQVMMGNKRELLQIAQTGNVISVGQDDDITSIDMTHTDTAMTTARKNVLENIASSVPMPAVIITQETFAEGFGEGTEDAKSVAEYVNRIRIKMKPLYDYFDKIVQYRAWNSEFYKTVQNRFPEYKNVPYIKAFYDWKNSFSAKWPSLIQEPESEKIKVEDTKLKSIIAMIEVLLPNLDPENKASLIDWAANNFNEQKMLFKQPLLLDIEALRNYVPPEPPAEPSQPKPFGATA